MNLLPDKHPFSISAVTIIALTISLFSGCATRKPDNKVNFGYHKVVKNWLCENRVPALGIGVIERGKITHQKVFGNLKDGIPAPENALFNIASITKPVVALMTLKLVAAGQWQLDEPLDNYWIDPDVAADPNHSKLTTRMILLHQSGFPNWRWNLPSKKLEFEYEPGTRYQYSGEGFEYLRKALEVKFQQPIEKLLDSILFKPLQMNNTSYWKNDLDTARFALWHDRQGKLYSGQMKTKVSAADDLITTVEDMCKFALFVMKGAGLPKALFDEMITRQVYVEGEYSRGLGWGIVSNLPKGEYALEHAGSDMGVRTRIILLPESERALVMFTNSDNGISVYKKVIEQSLDIGKQIIPQLK